MFLYLPFRLRPARASRDGTAGQWREKAPVTQRVVGHTHITSNGKHKQPSHQTRTYRTATGRTCACKRQFPVYRRDVATVPTSNSTVYRHTDSHTAHIRPSPRVGPAAPRPPHPLRRRHAAAFDFLPSPRRVSPDPADVCPPCACDRRSLQPRTPTHPYAPLRTPLPVYHRACTLVRPVGGHTCRIARVVAASALRAQGSCARSRGRALSCGAVLR